MLGHMSAGLTIVIVNKTIVHDHGLHAPALVSSTGALFTAVFTRALVFFGKVNVRPVGVKPWEFAFRRALPVGVFAAGSLCFGNMSYIYLDAGFVQMLKAGTPALLLFMLSVLRVEVVSFSTASLALLMVVGSTLATLQQPNATALGLTVQMISQLCEVLQCTTMQIFLQQLGFEAWDAGYYLAPAVAACCLLPSLVFEWPHIIADHKVGVLYEQVPLLVVSGTIGIVVNFSNQLVIKYTSSLMAKLLVIARSSALVLVFIVNGEPFTLLQVIGYVITLLAFAGYSLVKAWEIERQAFAEESAQDAEPRASDEDIPEWSSPSSGLGERTVDLTASMFWFSIFVLMAGGYQAAVIGDITSIPCFEFGKESEPYVSVSSLGLPPTPYLEPITAGVQVGSLAEIAWNRRSGQSGAEVDKTRTSGALGVESAAQSIYLADGRHLLHEGGKVFFGLRRPEQVLSSSWVASSHQFGAVHLRGLDSDGEMAWLSCGLSLIREWALACPLWMAAPHWNSWEKDGVERTYTFRHLGRYLGVKGQNELVWKDAPTTFFVADWVPESCPSPGMTPNPQSFSDAFQQVTFTMTTFFRVYVRSSMFKQAFASVLTHIREKNTYVKEFIVVSEWYDGNSLAMNGTYTGPDVHESRREMLDFFPGCVGMSTEEARHRPRHQGCTFVFKTKEERGRPRALNILLDVMRTKYWINFEDDHVLYEDVFLSRLLAPMYEHPDSCWLQQGGANSNVKVAPLQQTTSSGTEADWGSAATSSNAEGTGEFTRRRLSQVQSNCLLIAGVRLAGASGIPIGGNDRDETIGVDTYRVPTVLFNDSYVRELLAHGGLDDGADGQGWGAFRDVGAVPWPPFSLRPGLHNLSYISSLEAPLFFGGRPGRFSEDSNITTWSGKDGKTFNFRWNIELEFSVRWARGGATWANIRPGACMRDISNGISSFEKRTLDFR